MKKTKTQNGITLIALIITIVVLLILAGVTIQSIGDNGGLIKKAEQAADQYTVASEKELIDLAYTEYKIAKMSGAEGVIPKIEGATVVTKESGGWKVTFDKTGNSYDLFEDGGIGSLEYVWVKTAAGWNVDSLNDDTSIPEDATMVAKFYKTSEIINEMTLYLGDSTFNLPKGNAYKLVIEGNGPMGTILKSDLSVANGWANQAANYVQDQNNPYILPYVTDITIGDGVTTIGEGAFFFFASLRNIKISNTVNAIETFTFVGCESLTNVTLPSSIDTIDTVAFYPVLLDDPNLEEKSKKEYNIYIERTDPEGFNVAKVAGGGNYITMPAFVITRGTIYVRNEAMAAALEGTEVSDYVTIKIK